MEVTIPFSEIWKYSYSHSIELGSEMHEVFSGKVNGKLYECWLTMSNYYPQIIVEVTGDIEGDGKESTAEVFNKNLHSQKEIETALQEIIKKCGLAANPSPKGVLQTAEPLSAEEQAQLDLEEMKNAAFELVSVLVGREEPEYLDDDFLDNVIAATLAVIEKYGGA